MLQSLHDILVEVLYADFVFQADRASDGVNT
jgi:hypothetical protein